MTLDNISNDIPSQFSGKKNIEVFLSAFQRQLDELFSVFEELNSHYQEKTHTSFSERRRMPLFPMMFIARYSNTRRCKTTQTAHILISCSLFICSGELRISDTQKIRIFLPQSRFRLTMQALMEWMHYLEERQPSNRPE